MKHEHCLWVMGRIFFLDVSHEMQTELQKCHEFYISGMYKQTESENVHKAKENIS